MTAALQPDSASYRRREEYQLARALLADVCVATNPRPKEDAEAQRLRRSAVALPKLFIPSPKPLSAEEERDSQRILLSEIAEAVHSALASGGLDEGTAERLEERRQELLQRIESY